MNVSPIVLWTLNDWAEVVASLPAHGPLPRRNVLVPNERVAHALRRVLFDSKRHAALAGTRFLPLLELARERMADAGDALSINDVELTPTLVREAFTNLTLERFDPKELAELPGWDRAFARTIAELESAQVGAETLLVSEDAHVRDVGRVFQHVAGQAGRVTAAALLNQATAALRAQPEPLQAVATLAVVTGFESASEAAHLRALPGVCWCVWAVRPLREDHFVRLESLYGEDFARAMRTTKAPDIGDSALATLRRSLYGAKGGAPVDDASVEVVTYAGVHDEVEAAVAWVVEQLTERGLAAHEVALVSPGPDAYASLLSARLEALSWPKGSAPGLVERDLPLVERADGARLLAVVRALREGLPREYLAPLLSSLRCRPVDGAEPPRVHGLSHAWDLLNGVAWVGGERSHLGRGLEWGAAFQRAIARLEAASLEAAKDESAGDERAERARQSTQRQLGALLPAIEGLSAVLARVVEDRPLSELWAALRAYVADSLKLPPAAPPAWALIEDAVASHTAEASTVPHGIAALEWLEEQLLTHLVRSGRFGMPAVYLGSLQGLRGLSFRAVRVLGLVEGALPSAVREDAVLSDAARRVLSPLLPTSRSRAHRQLATLDDALRATTERLVLCAPRVSLDGGARQPAAVLLDVMGALGVPANALEETLAERAQRSRSRERRLLDVLPVSESARLLRIAAGDRGALTAPTPVTSLQALRNITRRREPGAQDGLLAGVIERARHPGLTSDNPISASRLSGLLGCPHRYLLENVLRFGDPSGPLPSFGLAPMLFGSLLHEVAEHFWNEHGTGFGERKHDLPYYQTLARTLGEASFDAFRGSYPFANDYVADAAREALCDQLSKLIEHDWDDGRPRRFVAVERGFGFDESCVLETEAGPLHVRGRIDRLDVEGDAVLVRDLKTGRGKPRKPDEAPSLDPDLQLGLYARVAQQLAQSWELPSKVGVAYVYLRSGEIERRWSGADYQRLHEESGRWLAAAVDTLEQAAFARTPDRSDCKYCSHNVICKSEHARTGQVLADPAVPARLRTLKEEAMP